MLIALAILLTCALMAAPKLNLPFLVDIDILHDTMRYSSAVEHFLAKEKVTGSNPVTRYSKPVHAIGFLLAQIARLVLVRCGAAIVSVKACAMIDY